MSKRGIWVPYVTPTIKYVPAFGLGYGTVVSIDVWWHRIGDRCIVQGECQIGTAAADVSTISLPMNSRIDSTRFSSGAPAIVGICSADTAADTSSFYVLVNPGASTFVQLGNSIGVASTNPMLIQNVGSIIGNNIRISFQFNVPVAGWSAMRRVWV